MDNNPEKGNTFTEPYNTNSDNATSAAPVFPESNNPYSDGSGYTPHSTHTQASTPDYTAGPVNPQYDLNNPEPTPVSIYNNTPRGDAPQYHYGMHHGFLNNQYLEEQRQRLITRRHHERKIKKLGTQNGTALILLLVLSALVSSALVFPVFYKLYYDSVAFANAFGIFYSVITMGGTYFVYSKFCKNSKYYRPVPFNKPADPLKAVLLILIGFGGCYLANIVTSFLAAFGEAIGIYSSYSALEDPSSIFDIFIMFLGTAIIPPLVEEYAIRGVVMQNLRRYGNGFAIIASALIFGILHGNAVQIPFAFMCGLFLGYAVIASESIWTGVIIHLLTNAMSCVSSALVYFADSDAANTFYSVAGWGSIIAAVLALIIYINRYKSEFILKNHGEASDISVRSKLGKFFSSPVMIIAIILYVFEAITTLSFSPNYS